MEQGFINAFRKPYSLSRGYLRANLKMVNLAKATETHSGYTIRNQLQNWFIVSVQGGIEILGTVAERVFRRIRF
jgi:hypothetical protein